ncbi:MAG: hypothetical protein IJ396_07470 [Oscillibacter sp.]|nr:hypothetical protein [Oscillibacter sp.]
MEAKTKGVIKLWEKYKIIGIVMAMGVVLLLWPSGADRSETGGTNPLPAEDGLQREMEEILSVMEGVGQVRVLLTTERSGEEQLAQDGDVAYSGNPSAPEDYSRRWETVLTNSEAVVTGRTSPVYRGALVVCQGGGQPAVRLAVTEAVAALTGLSADRITVAKWQ